MTKTQMFERLCAGKRSAERMLFRPILMHFAARFNGNSYAEFASDHKTLVECNLRAMEHFDTDMVGLISDPYRETSAFGAKVSFPEEAVPRCEQILVQKLEDVKSLKNPEVHKCERTLDRILGARLYNKMLKGNIPVIGWIEGPLAEACDLAGISQMLMHLMLQPDLSHSLLDKCVATAKDFAKAQLDEGCHIIGMGDAICSQIDLDTYNTFVKYRHAEIIDFIHENHGKVKLHICGNITHLLPSIRDLNVDILDIDFQVDPEEAYQILGPDVIRCGNINPVEIESSDPNAIQKWSEKLVQREKDRKFILSGGCEITVNTSHANLMAMRTASKYDPEL